MAAVNQCGTNEGYVKTSQDYPRVYICHCTRVTQYMCTHIVNSVSRTRAAHTYARERRTLANVFFGFFFFVRQTERKSPREFRIHIVFYFFFTPRRTNTRGTWTRFRSRPAGTTPVVAEKRSPLATKRARGSSRRNNRIVFLLL